MSVTRLTASHKTSYLIYTKLPQRKYYYHMTVEESEFYESCISQKHNGADGGNPCLPPLIDLFFNTACFCPQLLGSPYPPRHTPSSLDSFL